jgi:hypothetical protein
VVYSKWYRNSEHNTFTDVFKTFLQEAKAEGADIKVGRFLGGLGGRADPRSNDQ